VVGSRWSSFFSVGPEEDDEEEAGSLAFFMCGDVGEEEEEKGRLGAVAWG
jgi:hypothetical protein